MGLFLDEIVSIVPGQRAQSHIVHQFRFPLNNPTTRGRVDVTDLSPLRRVVGGDGIHMILIGVVCIAIRCILLKTMRVGSVE